MEISAQFSTFCALHTVCRTTSAASAASRQCEASSRARPASPASSKVPLAPRSSRSSWTSQPPSPPPQASPVLRSRAPKHVGVSGVSSGLFQDVLRVRIVQGLPRRPRLLQHLPQLVLCQRPPGGPPGGPPGDFSMSRTEERKILFKNKASVVRRRPSPSSRSSRASHDYLLDTPKSGLASSAS